MTTPTRWIALLVVFVGAAGYLVAVLVPREGDGHREPGSSLAVSTTIPPASSRCVGRVTIAQVRQAFLELGISLRLITPGELVGGSGPRARVYLGPKTGYAFNAALFANAHQAVVAQRKTPKRDPLLGFRLQTLRCGNFVVLFRPGTNGETIAGDVVAALG